MSFYRWETLQIHRHFNETLQSRLRGYSTPVERRKQTEAQHHRINALMAVGWEPFSVTDNYFYLRRRRLRWRR